MFQVKKKLKGDLDQLSNFTRSDIELILRLLSQTTFPVKDIETLYITLYKLQELHKKLVNEENS